MSIDFVPEFAWESEEMRKVRLVHKKLGGRLIDFLYELNDGEWMNG
jgi:hypothetical protein